MKYNKNQILIQLFNFDYAGLINIHICKNKKGFLVVSKGFEFINAKIILNKKSIVRKSHEDLQSAILTFSYLVKLICEEYSFFKMNYFDSKDFFKETILDVY